VCPSVTQLNRSKLKYSPYDGNDESLVNVTIMSTESDILHEIDFNAIIKDFAVAIEKGDWPLNVDCVGCYNHGGI